MPSIEINGLKMNYEDVGSGEVILFGHSFLWDNKMWQSQIELFSKNYRCIAPDLWGHGKSDNLQNEQISLTELSDNYIELMDKLNIDKFSIVGLSVGGMWGAHIAAKHPNRIEKLALLGTDLGKEPILKRFKYYLMIKMMEKAGSVPPKLIEKVVSIFFSPHTFENNTPLVDSFKDKLASITQESIPTISALARAIFWRGDFLNELKNISAETLVIVGKDDTARPPHESKRLAGIIPNAKLSTINNAGHITTCEQPDATNKVLEIFFNFKTNKEAA